MQFTIPFNIETAMRTPHFVRKREPSMGPKHKDATLASSFISWVARFKKMVVMALKNCTTFAEKD